jgi:hypothetical protein
MAIRELPLELLTQLCQHLGVRDLVHVSAICKRFRHGGLETVELPTESPVVTALLQHAFPRPEQIPSVRPNGCSESWVAYLARCARQRNIRELLPIAAGSKHSLFADASGRLLSCGEGAAVGHGDVGVTYPIPTTVAALTGVWVQSVAVGDRCSFALGWDGRVYSWGSNESCLLEHGDRLDRPSPALVEGLEGVRSIAADGSRSHAVTPRGTSSTGANHSIL